MQIQISWLLQKPTDLDLHCLQRQSISGFSRTRVNAKHVGKNFSRHFEMFFLFFPVDRIQHFMQIVSFGDNLLEMPNPISGKNKKNVANMC